MRLGFRGRWLTLVIYLRRCASVEIWVGPRGLWTGPETTIHHAGEGQTQYGPRKWRFLNR